jgi:hypothetical protein
MNIDTSTKSAGERRNMLSLIPYELYFTKIWNYEEICDGGNDDSYWLSYEIVRNYANGDMNTLLSIVNVIQTKCKLDLFSAYVLVLSLNSLGFKEKKDPVFKYNLIRMMILLSYYGKVTVENLNHVMDDSNLRMRDELGNPYTSFFYNERAFMILGWETLWFMFNNIDEKMESYYYKNGKTFPELTILNLERQTHLSEDLFPRSTNTSFKHKRVREREKAEYVNLGISFFRVECDNLSFFGFSCVKSFGARFLYSSQSKTIDVGNFHRVEIIDDSFMYGCKVQKVDFSPMKRVRKIGTFWLGNTRYLTDVNFSGMDSLGEVGKGWMSNDGDVGEYKLEYDVNKSYSCKRIALKYSTEYILVPKKLDSSSVIRSDVINTIISNIG